MAKTGWFTKIMALAGTVLMWMPIVFPVLLGAGAFISRGQVLFDYLMPAELFPCVLLGGLLLLWAAVRARSRRAWLAWSLGAAVVTLFGGQAYAFFVGLADGRIAAEGLPWALVIASLSLYTAAVTAAALGGLALIRDLYPKVRPAREG
jgi:hypothetical protein